MCESAPNRCQSASLAHPRYHTIAHRDYEKALKQALWGRFTRQLRQQPTHLLPFAAVWDGKAAYRDLGLHAIDINRIVGSSGRYTDYDPAFRPARREDTDRWVYIAQAHYEGVELPPINLYKVGDWYYVEDGNHRVSVARLFGHESITAKIIELADSADWYPS